MLQTTLMCPKQGVGEWAVGHSDWWTLWQMGPPLFAKGQGLNCAVHYWWLNAAPPPITRLNPPQFDLAPARLPDSSAHRWCCIPDASRRLLTSLLWALRASHLSAAIGRNLPEGAQSAAHSLGYNLAPRSGEKPHAEWRIMTAAGVGNSFASSYQWGLSAKVRASPVHDT